MDFQKLINSVCSSVWRWFCFAFGQYFYIVKGLLVALLNLYSWCLVMVEWLFLAVPWGCLRFVIVVFPDHTLLQFLQSFYGKESDSWLLHLDRLSGVL